MVVGVSDLLNQVVLFAEWFEFWLIVYYCNRVLMWVRYPTSILSVYWQERKFFCFDSSLNSLFCYKYFYLYHLPPRPKSSDSTINESIFDPYTLAVDCFVMRISS